MHRFGDCDTCQRNVLIWGRSYYNLKTGDHPRPPDIIVWDMNAEDAVKNCKPTVVDEVQAALDRMAEHDVDRLLSDGGDLTACEEAGCFCEATKSAPVDARRTLTAKTWTLLSGLSLEGFTIQAVSVNPTGTLTVDFLLNAASDNLNVVRDRILWELGEAFSTRAGEVSYSMAAISDPLIEASMQIDLGPRFELDPLSSPG
jgi:hypothetical protein